LRLTNILEREAKALPNRIQAGWTCQNSQRGRGGIEQHSRLALLRIRQVTFAWQGGRQGRSEIEKLAFWDENQLGKKEWKRGASRCQTKCEPQKGKSNNRVVSSSPSFSPTPTLIFSTFYYLGRFTFSSFFNSLLDFYFFNLYYSKSLSLLKSWPSLL